MKRTRHPLINHFALPGRAPARPRSRGGIIGLLLLALAVFPTRAHPLPPPPLPPGPLAPAPSYSSFLKSLDCTVVASSRTAQCRRLPAFPDNRWDHPELPAFASQVAELVQKVMNAYPAWRPVVQVQGIADARRIVRFRSWEEAPEECRRERSGNVSNESLAQLRGCAAGIELKRVLPEGVRVEEQPPVDYSQPGSGTSTARELLVGDTYKAVVISIFLDDAFFSGAQ